jgi:hypothetical protein
MTVQENGRDVELSREETLAQNGKLAQACQGRELTQERARGS